jgi:hypothetical protein
VLVIRNAIQRTPLLVLLVQIQPSAEAVALELAAPPPGQAKRMQRKISMSLGLDLLVRLARNRRGFSEKAAPGAKASMSVCRIGMPVRT